MIDLRANIDGIGEQVYPMADKEAQQTQNHLGLPAWKARRIQDQPPRSTIYIYPPHISCTSVPFFYIVMLSNLHCNEILLIKT